GLFGPDNVFAKPSRGAVTAFGSAFGILVLVAGAGPALSVMSGSGAQVSAAAAFEPNWQVNVETSSIGFSGIHDGNAFSGSFSNWDAAIQFDPDALQNAEVRVTVSTVSATASQKLYTDSLPSAEWFNTSAFPTASVEILDIESAGAGAYTSTARLTLKDLTVDAPFPFTLNMDGDQAEMTGQAVFQRTPLDLGQSSDPGADWVSEDITVDVVVEASRLN
ncbi:MAG: YceI family protein, partial [Pseudomonadota bacterium]